jgi:hypothetical protein
MTERVEEVNRTEIKNCYRAACDYRQGGAPIAGTVVMELTRRRLAEKGHGPNYIAELLMQAEAEVLTEDLEWELQSEQ